MTSGGVASSAKAAAIKVQIKLTTYQLAVRRVQGFSLSCNPTGGNLPLAARVCGDIARHPKAMLDPPHPGLPRRSIVCLGGPSMPRLDVTVTTTAGRRVFAGSPECNWPGNQALAVYYDAATRDTRYLNRSESELRCDEDPMLFRIPTPLASVVACRNGLWTPRSEQLIRLAESSPTLSPFEPAKIFPHDIGVLPCTIHAGGPFPGRRFPGHCGVAIKTHSGKATVSFSETWPTGTGKSARHSWRVFIRGKRLIGTSQGGQAAPQSWD